MEKIKVGHQMSGESRRGPAAPGPPVQTFRPSFHLARQLGNQRFASALAAGGAGAPRGGRIQPKLEVGAPDDALELEADSVADKVMSGASVDSVKAAAPARIRRKCGACQAEEDEEEKKPIQRKAVGGSTVAGPDLPGQLSGSKGGGIPLPAAVGDRMGAALGASFGGVRVHTDDNAARMNRDLRARAFTHGTDIYFKDGEYNPATLEGQRLLAHELVHVVQQGGAGGTLRRDEDAPDNVSLVELSCASNTITFHASTGDLSYTLNQCDIVEGEFDAKVTTNAANGSVNFDIDDERVPKDAFKFGFDIGPGQKNPVTLFSRQKTVKISAQSGKTTVNAATTLDEFKTMVKEAGKLRMEGNKLHLEAWKKFLTEKLSETQLQGQAMANQANQLGTIAAKEGGMTMNAFDDWARTDNPLLAWVKEQQIRGRYRACTGCHATVQATDRWRDRPTWTAPYVPAGTALQQHAALDSANPAPRPEGLGKESPVASLDKFAGFDSATQAMTAAQQLKPYLDELGPSRYGVLPNDVFTGLTSKSALSCKIRTAIEQRQADYDLFKAKIAEPGFDYLTLRPIVKDLLPLATAEVQQKVNDEIASAQKWEIVKAGGIGLATIGLIVLAIFPPTSALGIAGVLALETSLGAYGVYSGIEMYQQGALLSKGTGADDVIDPEQQKSADTMMAMGLLTVGLSAVSVASSGFKAVTLIRSTGTGTKALGAVASIEARLESGATVKITELGGSSPKVVVLGKDGELLAEGTIPQSAITGKPLTPTKLSDLPNSGIKGATPRAGTPERPVSFQGEAPTCGAVSCEMVASTGRPVDRALLKRMLEGVGEGGVSTDEVVSLFKLNKVASEAKTGWKVANLAAATEGGNPAVAMIKTTAGDHGLHFVVVDGVTVRNGVRVVAVRNPWGLQYFQSESEFAKIFTGNAVKVLHWY